MTEGFSYDQEPTYLHAASETGPVLTRLADVAPERLTWLWDGRFPRGKLVILDGDPSVGKSTLTVDWAARVSTGKPWPDDAPCDPGDVIIMSAEDGLADTIRPRLDAAEGEPARVHALTAIRSGEDERTLTLADVATIEQAVRQAAAVLVIVDVLMAYMPAGTNAHRDQDVRTVLAALAAMADRTRAVVLCLRHLNKSGGGNAMYRGGGSIGIIGAARAGYVAGADPDDENRRLLACVKSNLAAEPPTLAYRLVSAENGTARVEWLGQTQHKAGDLIAQREDDDQRSERDEAADWLVDYLADNGGQAASVDVYRAGAREGYSKDTLKRAKRPGGVESVKGGMKAGWVWRIAGATPIVDHRREHEEREERSSVDPAPFAPFVLPSSNSHQGTP